MEGKGLQVSIEPMEHLLEYEQVPIGYWIEARLRRDLTEADEPRRWKDYDSQPDARPSAYPGQVDVAHWVTVVARENERRVGGAIVAWNGSDFNMLEGRTDLAVLVDLRVCPDTWGRGIGRRLFEAAEAWARERGCSELRVETQDVNVPACRFYRRMGCRLLRWVEGAYGSDPDEAMLLWSKSLQR